MADNYFNNDFDNDYVSELFNLLFVESAGKAIDELDRKVSNFLNKVERYLTLTSIDFLTYRELISFILSNKPIDEEIAKAAVVKKYKDSKFNFTVVYLDSNNKPIWKDSNGKVICFLVIANRIEEEIKDIFGDKDVVIIE